MSIEVKNISKNYGTQKALDNISFSIKKGEIVGFLGPNGAGKSTLMKILTTYLKPDSGSAKVNDFDLETQPKNIQQSIGYLPEHNPLYLDMYVREYLDFNAGIYHTNPNRIQEVIALTGLESHAHKKIDQLSKGYRQRLGLAAALLHQPKVLILDEPTTGLDPNQLVEIRNLIKNIAQNTTILLSTHILQEVEAICNRVIIINKGQIVADKPLQNLTQNQNQTIEVEFDLKIEPQLLATLQNLTHFDNIHHNLWQLSFDAPHDIRPIIFDFATQNGLKTLQINQKNKNLETLFREITQ